MEQTLIDPTWTQRTGWWSKRPGLVDQETVRAVLNRFPLLTPCIAIAVPVFKKQFKNRYLKNTSSRQQRTPGADSAINGHQGADNVATDQRSFADIHKNQ
ncbi:MULTISPECIES: hypothetical protein [Chromohalobacter]|uniref:hypothetical protein n=1 Tax=Chromohalobacter TaxID=42054 RepID=UPI00105EEA25|nr:MULTISPECIES: hypothetical protein [Chromohalobacter]MCI0509194.1 hypothetical protein [Chromohalobacter sp.]MCI0593885.1 hypothetical protein [Chromohalobacter sp.]